MRRAFSSTPRRQVDLSALYEKIRGWRRSKPSTTQNDTKTLVDPTKTRPDAAQEEMPEDSQPRRLKVLGLPKNPRDDWERVRQFAEFEAFPTNHYRRDIAKDSIIEAVTSAFNSESALNDIAQRFEGFKKIQKNLNIAIPDHVLSSVTSRAELEDYLSSAVKQFDEKQPDAVYLDPEDFAGTNIVISDPQAERKMQKKRYRQLLNEAKKAQEQHVDELLRSSEPTQN